MSRLENQAPELDKAVAAKIDSLIEEKMAQHRLPGLAMSIVMDGQVVYTRGAGMADLEHHRPVTSASLFRVASVSKPFTAVAIMQLVELGKLDLDTRLAEVLPYFRLADPRYVAITVRHLLAHTSGLPTDPAETTPPWKAYNFECPDWDEGAAERFVRSLGGLSLLADPGAPNLLYSNVGFDILADVIAKVSGQSYEAYLHQHVLEPLQMAHSTFMLDEADAALLTRPYLRDAATGVVTAWPFYPFNRRHSPSDGLITNLDDLNHWMLMLLNRGEWHGRRIVTAASLETMWSPVTRPEGGDLLQMYGLGWILAEANGHRVVWHVGACPGFTANFILAPDDGIAVSTLANSYRYLDDEEPYHAMEVGNTVIKLLLGIEE